MALIDPGVQVSQWVSPQGDGQMRPAGTAGWEQVPRAFGGGELSGKKTLNHIRGLGAESLGLAGERPPTAEAGLSIA
jgi:hypothetical protein